MAGLDHHELGAARIQQLDEVLTGHGLAAEEVLDVVAGRRGSVLSGAPGVLKVDHLDSLVRSARAHGRTRQPPPETLARLRVVDGCVSAGPVTAAYLVELVAGEARLHCSAVNVVATGVVRHLAGILLRDATPVRIAQVAAMTDEEFWCLLMTHPATADAVRTLRGRPHRLARHRGCGPGGFTKVCSNRVCSHPFQLAPPVPGPAASRRSPDADRPPSPGCHGSPAGHAVALQRCATDGGA